MILLGKFTNDPVEGGFGWYRRIKWWQLLCQLRSYFRLKRDSLPESTVLRQNALHSLAHLNTSSTNTTQDDMEALDCLEETRFKKKWASEIEVDKVMMMIPLSPIVLLGT